MTVAGYESQRSRFEQAGLPFTTLPRSGSWVQPAGSEMEVRMALYQEVANAEHLTEVPELAAGYDGVVIDCLAPLRIVAAANLSQPSAVLFHTGVEFFKPSPTVAPFLAVINAAAQSHGFAPRTNLLEYPGIDRVIVATLPELDEYSQQADARWHWVGPVPGPAPASLDEPLLEAGDRPLVLVGLTTHTAYGPQTELMQNILDALSELSVRVVATTRPAIDARALRVPKNAIVRDYLPHRTLMPRVAVCVTHGGHGTLTEALLQGVPLVCLPHPRSDQLYLAQRVAALGAGVFVDRDSPPAAIREAVQTVLSTGSFRDSAKSLQKRIGEGGANRAAELLESMVSERVAAVTK